MTIRKRRTVRDLSLCETLDQVLETGVVLSGEIIISIAKVDLVYLNLTLVLSSVETLTASMLPVAKEDRT